MADPMTARERAHKWLNQHFGIHRSEELTKPLADLIEADRAAQLASPTDMILFCPNCGEQHIDAPETEIGQRGDRWEKAWNNPPHKSHLCHFCQHIWRPADVPTNGVQHIATTGKADSPHVASAKLAIESRQLAALTKGLDVEGMVKHMVDRFLGWRLPKPWHPDNGISYQRPNYAHASADTDWPTGTNLFDADQAEAMVRHMLDELPALLAAARIEPFWRDIAEYDPLCDGEIVDVWATHVQNQDEGFQRFPAARIRKTHLGQSWTNYDGSTSIRPTHFMRLPQAPLRSLDLAALGKDAMA